MGKPHRPLNETVTINLNPSFLVFVTLECAAGGLLAAYFKVDAVIIGWLVLTMILFTSGGWFFRELGKMTGWASMFLFIFSWSLTNLIHSVLPLAAFSSFWAGMIAGLLRERIKSTGRWSGPVGSKLLFPALSILMLGLVLSSLSDWATRGPLLGTLLPFAAIGWLAPEFSATTAKVDNASFLAKIAPYRGVLFSLAVIMTALSATLLQRASLTPLLPLWFLTLLLLICLRGSFFPKDFPFNGRNYS